MEAKEKENGHVYNLRRERRARGVKYTFSPERKRRKMLSKQSQLADRKLKKRLIENPKAPYVFPLELKKIKKYKEVFPDKYWKKEYKGIKFISSKFPLKLIKKFNFTTEWMGNEVGWGYGGGISGLDISSNGKLLAAACSSGVCLIIDLDTLQIIQTLRDKYETNIEEFYCAKFVEWSGSKIALCGKIKSRSVWSEEDEDNFCLPGSIKIFDLVSGDLVLKLDGHGEEILCLKQVLFKNQYYLLSCGQDGRIIKWTILDNFSGYEYRFIDDMTTHYVCSLAFLPNCGNKYFVAAGDEGIKIYDFEAEILVKAFPDLYSSFCDCIKFTDISGYSLGEGESLLLSRGVELVDVKSSLPTAPNKCHLWKLSLPISLLEKKTSENNNNNNNDHEMKIEKDNSEDEDNNNNDDENNLNNEKENEDEEKREGVEREGEEREGEEFGFSIDDIKLEQVRVFQDPDHYEANTWLMKFASNGRYIAAPTSFGRVVIWNLISGDLVGVLFDHDDREIRDVIFHQHRKLLITCCDDATICIYESEEAV